MKKKIFALRPWRSFLPGIGSARSPSTKNNYDIPTTDTTEIKRLITRVKREELDQGDAQLIEKLLNFLLTIVFLLERKHTSIRRMKELLFGMKEKMRGKDEAKNRAEESRSGVGENSQSDSPKESASSSTCEGDSSTQEVRRPGHGRKAASDYPGARLVRLNHPEMAPGDPCPEYGCEGHLHQLEQPNVKIYLTGQPMISATWEKLYCRRSANPESASDQPALGGNLRQRSR